MKDKYKEEDITVLSARDQVRLRPQLFFQTCFEEKALDQLVFEIVCHALDEHVDGNCHKIDMTIGKDDFEVCYDAGMPLEKRTFDHSIAEVLLTAILTCRHEKKHELIGNDFCEVGIATVNFASELCRLETISNGQKGTFLFEDGVTVSRLIENCANEAEHTRLYFKPSSKVFGSLGFTQKGIESRADFICTGFPQLQLTTNYTI